MLWDQVLTEGFLNADMAVMCFNTYLITGGVINIEVLGKEISIRGLSATLKKWQVSRGACCWVLIVDGTPRSVDVVS
jgi:hypothetical protein